jgi:hypothetical protein
MTVDYGNERAMCSSRFLSLAFLALIMVGGGCVRALPPSPAGVTLQPGRYLEAYYRAPDFSPVQFPYSLTPFTLETAQGVTPDTFLPLLERELVRAWEANGLKVAAQGDACLLSGTVHQVSVRGTSLRFLLGRIKADLSVSGAITREGQTLFAFQDRIHLTSPLKPGPSAPKEVELLLRQVVRTFTIHLMNELLLHGFTASGE